MNRRTLFIAILAVAVLAAAGIGLYWLGVQQGRSAAAPAAAPAGGAAEGEDATRRHIASGLKAGDVDPVSGRKILYYHDPMVPGNRFDRPGKSPFMDMMLVPVFAGGGTAQEEGGVAISPRLQQNLGVRTAVATEGALASQLSAVGSIEFNERDQVVVQARATAFVQQLHVRAALDAVRAGQVLAELHVPDWVAVQEEFLALRRMQGSDLGPLVEGARARMRQAGMDEAQIRQVEASGRADAKVAIRAPIAGLVTEIGARDGMAVMPGATLFKLNGFATVWAHAQVPESQAAALRRGGHVVAETPMVPGERFEGRVQQLLPSVDAATRTVTARVELSNRRGQLVPGMFVTMNFTAPQARKLVLVPSEALIHTGRRVLVMLADEGGAFRPVEVEPGVESGGQIEIRRGVQAGQKVVVSSQFLIDSEASLKGIEARLNQMPAAPASAPAAGAPRHQGKAKIEAITPEALTLSHGPIPSIRWGAMTMDFKRPADAAQLPPGIKVGDSVNFEFYMDKDDLPQLTRVWPAGPAAAASGARR